MTNSFYCSPLNKSGGLALWWNNSTTISISSSSENMIIAEIDHLAYNLNGQGYFVYGKKSLPTHLASSSSQKKSVWKMIWKIKCPPKLRNFLWRVCSNSLPTAYNLFKRSCGISPLCLICSSALETTEHFLLECTWTKLVWFASPLGLRQSIPISPKLCQWLELLISASPSKIQALDLLTTFTYTAWSIWKMRNSFIFFD
ncbi:hypothetical protein POM88_018669 [Heracleum sosnowskyi]|uniref:Reverse transcriptase zinc-binding domain-containing protein n=1 Tax=Heracleum sosnowskyi TaxID=360622 RepID=A0AAD8ITD8_9APIA|nr:hypothetical protein POM88_018669 [Heracleum sosnowskyi]